MRRLRRILPKQSGRNNSGKITMRHQGGRQKRFLRLIDFKRDKSLPGKVRSIEYDPNRGVDIALIYYPDGDKGYILCPVGLNIGDEVESSPKAGIKTGNALPLLSIPVGTMIHNVELIPGEGGKLARGAGTFAQILAQEGKYAQIKMPSSEVRRVRSACLASVGQLSNVDLKNQKLKKAGDSRHRGIRPTVRGTAQNPRSHPHGGGEGRSGIGLKYPKTPWGKNASKRTRSKRKYSDRMIIQRRKQ